MAYLAYYPVALVAAFFALTGAALAACTDVGTIDLNKYPDSNIREIQTGLRAEWETRLRPTMSEIDPSRLEPGQRDGISAGLRILRPIDDLDELDSLDQNYTARITAEVIQVVDRDGNSAFDVRRDGDWSLLAWEAPRAGLQTGRLWVADEAGLRGFEP